MGAAESHEIQQLAAAYADAMSRGDVRGAVETFTSDGRLETPASEPAVGHTAITAVVAEKMATLELIFQTVHIGLIVVNGNHAEAKFPITEWSRRAEDSQPFLLLGWYEDEAVRLDKGWRFSRRRLVPRTVAKSAFMSGPLLPVSAPQPPGP